jgi:hypothetical protein
MLADVVVALAITVPSAIVAALIALILRPRYLLYYVLPWKRRDDGSWEVNIYLSNRGRRDITREAFGNNQPLKFDIGVPIRKLVGVVSSPEVLRAVQHRAEGTRLFVGPELIGRRQDLRFTLITDREPRGIGWQQSSNDFQVRRPFIVDAPPRSRWMYCFAGVFLVYLVAIFAVLAALDSLNDLYRLAAVVIGFAPFGFWIFYRRYFPAPLE